MPYVLVNSWPHDLRPVPFLAEAVGDRGPVCGVEMIAVRCEGGIYPIARAVCQAATPEALRNEAERLDKEARWLRSIAADLEG